MFFSQAEASFNIESEKNILLDYYSYSELNEKIDTWELKISLAKNKWVELINDRANKKIKLNVIWEEYKDKWLVYISYKNKLSAIWYKIDLKSEKFDISDSFQFKRIQERPLSCESSAAADIISHVKWIEVDEFKVYDLMSKDIDREPTKSWSTIIWWNPDKWFVWNIWYYWKNKNKKPYQKLYTWYWVYEKPVKEVYDKFSIKTQIINKKNYDKNFWPKQHLRLSLENLKKWNMVQLWWDFCTDPNYEDGTIDREKYSQKNADDNLTAKNNCITFSENRKLEWYYDNGNWKMIKHEWLAWEHAFYLLWFEWDINNPKKIIVWDTYTGYHRYETIEWMRKWEAMDYRSLIVYKENKTQIAYTKNKLKKHFFPNSEMKCNF